MPQLAGARTFRPVLPLALLCFLQACDGALPTWGSEGRDRIDWPQSFPDVPIPHRLRSLQKLEKVN
jgi:hypothetical protein